VKIEVYQKQEQTINKKETRKKKLNTGIDEK